MFFVFLFKESLNFCHSHQTNLGVCEIQVLGNPLQKNERCLHDVFLRAGSRKTVLVISNSCSAHFLKRRSPLLLHFLTLQIQSLLLRSGGLCPLWH